METNTRPPKKNIGRNIQRLREMMGIKQDVLADKLGLSQQKISKIEQSETIEEALLEQVAEALGVTPEAIKDFDEEKVVYNIQNNHDTSNRGASNFIGTNNYSCTFNALDKLMEVIDENKRLYEELINTLKEKNALLKEQLGKK